MMIIQLFACDASINMPTRCFVSIVCDRYDVLSLMPSVTPHLCTCALWILSRHIKMWMQLHGLQAWAYSQGGWRGEYDYAHRPGINWIVCVKAQSRAVINTFRDAATGHGSKSWLSIEKCWMQPPAVYLEFRSSYNNALCCVFIT